MIFFCIGLSVLPLLFYAIIYICVDSWVFILWVIIQYLFIYLVQIILVLAIGNSFSWLLCSFNVQLSVYLSIYLYLSKTSLFYGTSRYSRLILYISCPVLESANFPMSLFNGEWYQKPKSGCQMGSLLLACCFF